jgi:hypothetical protein
MYTSTPRPDTDTIKRIIKGNNPKWLILVSMTFPFSENTLRNIIRSVIGMDIITK